MKVALVNTRISDQFAEIECTYDHLPPVATLPLLACETERRLLKQGASVEIQAFDRPVVTTQLVQILAEHDVVGFTTWFSNTSSALDLACRIKTENPAVIIVFGGPDATNLNDRLLNNRNFIDYIVAGDGEDSLWRIALGHLPSSIPNLWYREHSGTKLSYLAQISLDEIEPYDFRHIVGLDLQRYDSRISDYSYDPSRMPISIAWTKGCPRARKNNRCAYCSIPGKTVRSMSAKRAWAQVEHLKRMYGIMSFFDCGDDLASGSFARDLLNSPYRVSPINLRSYAGLWGLTEKKIRILKETGLSEVFVGLESTDDIINDWSGHHVSRRLVYDTFERLQDYGITVCVSFILGLPEESKASLRTAEALATDLVDQFDNIRMVLVSLGIPLIGSRWFTQLSQNPAVCNSYNNGNLATTDQPNYAKLLELSVENYCNVELKTIVSTIHRLQDRLSSNISVGWFGDLHRSVSG